MIRGIIVETFPYHVDVRVSYSSHDVTFYPGKSQFWDGNICRLQRRHVTKRFDAALFALGSVAE